MSGMLPVSSVRALGSDPAPYLSPDTGERSGAGTYLRPCYYLPRPEFTHVPAAPSELFCHFRDEWDRHDVYGEYDLGEYAEMTLANTVPEGSREMRLFRRFLTLCAAVLPRPYALFEREGALTRG